MTAEEAPSTPVFDTLHVEIEDGVAVLTLDRPDKLNALSAEALEELHAVLDILEEDPDVGGLIVTGAGKAFVAGADIEWMSEIDPLTAADFSRMGQAAFFKLEESRMPVIAAVNGYCLGGGCELAMACDFILASEKAVFGQPEAKLGLVPGFMGSQRLPRLVGTARAKELLLSGRTVDAQEALRIGLAVEVVAPDALLERAKEKMKEILGNGPIALETVKRLVNQGYELDKRTAGSMEAESFGLLFSTDDHAEGIAAFLDKRKAEFTGE
ncbi:MAG: enoyl-CoA hydratase/isomerase family protein [Euryarchaeota archaeon]|nr:enoyl-CoA hydratase/isomerase family protein [Euryarchaeota archaeon]